MESLKKLVSNHAISELKEYREHLLKERNRQIEIKEKYGIKSLNHLIVKLDGELIGLYNRREQGESVNLPIINKEERKERYEKSLKELKERIEKEKSLTMSMPRFVGIIRVKPAESINKAMQSDEKIERIGMQVVMEHEIKEGRNPEDVSAENLGFDIRSKDENDVVRYIEVKARSGTGEVALTQNEWFKAQRFGDDYYLYAVMNAATEPKLYIIQNPAINLEPEQVEVVRYIVPFNELKTKGDKHG